MMFGNFKPSRRLLERPFKRGTLLAQGVRSQKPVSQARRSYAAQQGRRRSFLVPASFISGGLGGTLGSLCGLGGGIVMIPALKQFTTLTTHQITATSLFAISLSSFFGAGGYIQNGTADVPAACALVTTAAVSSALGAKAAQFVSAKVLSRSLAVVMLVSIPVILARERTGGPSKPVVDPHGFATLRKQCNAAFSEGHSAALTRAIAYMGENLHLLGIGVLTGFSSGALGIGGGIVMTTCLGNFPGKEMPQHTAVATSLVAMVPTGITATVVNTLKGSVHFKAGIILATSSSVAMYYTARYIAPNVDERYMRYIFAIVLGASAVRMLV